MRYEVKTIMRTFSIEAGEDASPAELESAIKVRDGREDRGRDRGKGLVPYLILRPDGSEAHSFEHRWPRRLQ